MAKRLQSKFTRTTRSIKAPRVRKATVHVLENGDVEDAVISTQPLPSTSIYAHHDLGPLPDDGDYQMYDQEDPGDDFATTDPLPQDVAFFRDQAPQVPSSARTRDLTTWSIREQSAFDDWTYSLDDLVAPYLSVTRNKLPDRATWSSLSCTCGNPPTVHVLLIDLNAAQTFSVRSCNRDLPEVLVRAGAFPSTISSPRVAFSFSYIRFFLTLQETTRIGAFNFAYASLQAISYGTSEVVPSASWTSRDTGRRPLRSASEWLQALDQRCYQVLLGSAALFNLTRPTIEDDDLTLTLEDLASRCPACFGGLLHPYPSSTPTSPPKDPQVIVCLDGNFQHKRIRCKDAVSRTPRSPTYFLSFRQLTAARRRFEDPDVPEGPRTGCTSEVRAAIDGTVKTTKVDFDIGGVVGMTCRHGSPLMLVDVHASGEKHYYAYALIEALLDTCGPKLESLGICYDIGCKFSVSPRLAAALDKRGHTVTITHVVSVFHVYGHAYDCQLRFSPRRTPGFGLTDGEALERLWSSLSDLVSLTRHMTQADRLSTLTSRLEYLARKHRQDLFSTIQRHLVNISKEQQQQTQEFLKLLPYLIQYTDESVADAYSLSSQDTGLPSRLTTFINTQIARRRAIAFQNNEVTRQLVRRLQSNRSNRIVDLSVQAKQLYMPLRSWHALAAVLRGRHAQHSHDGTARLADSKNTSATEAKTALPALNAAIEKYQAVLPARLQHRLHPINADLLFIPANLTYVRGLLSPADAEEEPWVVDSFLAAAMDIVDLINRLNEEQTRIAQEVTNIATWFTIVQDSLYESFDLYNGTESSLLDPDRAAFVSRQIASHRCIYMVWKARLEKIEHWQHAHTASLHNQRAVHRREDQVARFDRLIAQHTMLTDSWSTWATLLSSRLPTPSERPDSSSPTSPLHTDRGLGSAEEDSLARALVEDEDEDAEGGEEGFPCHPLDLASSARTDYAEEGQDELDDRRLAELLSAVDVFQDEAPQVQALDTSTDGPEADPPDNP
ncbi:hypothetical protein CF319_g2801 [Tilletia indica]|nr:hypothetical protein CF319_g2801 [Tilletia indica]